MSMRNSVAVAALLAFASVSPAVAGPVKAKHVAVKKVLAARKHSGHAGQTAVLAGLAGLAVGGGLGAALASNSSHSP
ncbi:MAG: hypothetical protein KGL21_06625 [Alphaproteobacteria bacterium]|nr:hypothetical protein [Alphaproteobacteria bacterium]